MMRKPRWCMLQTGGSSAAGHFALWCLVLITPLPATIAATMDTAALIPRSILFGNPERSNVQLSHDGKQISYVAPHDGVLNVWIAPADDLSKAKVVTRDTKRGIREYYWAWTHDAILYRQDDDG